MSQPLLRRRLIAVATIQIAWILALLVVTWTLLGGAAFPMTVGLSVLLLTSGAVVYLAVSDRTVP